jgi:hypothetical protein
MILDIPDYLEDLIETASIHRGLTVEEYILINVCPKALREAEKRQTMLQAANLSTVETTFIIEASLGLGLPCP